MRTLRFSLLVMILASGLASVTNAAEALSAEAKADFEWFRGLGFPDVKDKQFVKFFPGSTYQNLEESRSDSFQYGFLVSSNGTSFTVLDSNLRQHTFTNFPARPPQRIQSVYGGTFTNVSTFYYRASGLAKVDLKLTVNELLAAQEKATDYAVLNQFRNHYPDGWLAMRASFFILAWDCWRQGLTDEAQSLYVVVGSMPQPNGSMDTGLSLRAKMEQDLGKTMIWRATVDFGDTNISRAELLKQFQIVEKNYPGSPYHARAKNTAERLTKMIAEDETHAKSPSKPLDQLSVDDRVRELIFRLREQNGQQWSQPGECDIFMLPNGATNSAAHQLVAIGLPAVPQLIAALDDPTFTRSVGFGRDFFFSHTVLTVGDCSVAILQRIASRIFYTHKSSSSYLSVDGDLAQVRKDVESWYREITSKGEKQTLIADTEAGDSPDQAKALWDKYPDAAPDAIIKGIQASKKYWTREPMLALLGKTNTSNVNDFLDKEMHGALDEDSRVIAATLLRDRGRTDGNELVIKVWTNHEDKFNLLISFLAQSESPKAIEALIKDVRARPVGERWQIMEACAGAGHSRTPAVADAAEKSVVSMLDDTDETGGSYWWNGDIGTYNNPRVCDRAGMLLNQLWPERYKFNLLASPKVREQQLVECQNVWRKANGLNALPLPEAGKHEVVRQDANKVTGVVWAEDGIKPDDAFAGQVEALKGKSITGSNVVDIMTSYISRLASKNIGIDFKIRRDEDLTGVRVSVSLSPIAASGIRGEWQRNRTMKLGRQDLLSGGGGIFLEYAKKASDWEDVNRAVSTAVAAEPETPFYLHLKVFTSQPGSQDPQHEHLAGAAW